MRTFKHETARLALRELTRDDATFMLRLLNDPGWLRFIGARKVRTVDDARKYLRSGPMASYRAHGFGLYLVETRSRREPVGICGLVRRPELDAPDLGFAFTVEHSGKGYATESGRVVVEHAHAKRRLDRLLAITSTDNEGSIQVLEKLGFRRLETRSVFQDDESLHIFERIATAGRNHTLNRPAVKAPHSRRGN